MEEKKKDYKKGGYAVHRGGERHVSRGSQSYGRGYTPKSDSDNRKYSNTAKDSAVDNSADEADSEASGLIIGRNAVRELLKSGATIDKILVSGREGSIVALVAQAKEAKIPVIETDAAKLDRLACGEHHQGIIAYAAQKEYSTIDEILAIAEERGEKPLIVVCDGVEDPHNLGAIIRTAECAGAHGVIIPKRRAVGLTAAVAKASAGALVHMAVARVTNIASAIDELKEKGVWCFAAEAGGDNFYETDFSCPCAIVMGGEDSGVSRLVKDKCDYTVSIPMRGKVNSMNVSAAAAVLITYASLKQRNGGES